jgi:hypothetical protein
MTVNLALRVLPLRAQNGRSMTTETSARSLGSIQENSTGQNGIRANIASIVATTLNPETHGTVLPIAEAMYLSYSYSDEEPLTREQWATENGWGRHFTQLETQDPSEAVGNE